MKTTLLVGSGLVVLAVGCGGHGAKQGAANPASERRGTATAGVAGVSWEVPPGWTAKPAGGMRFATYTIPAARGAAAGECAVYYFGADQGGTVDANVTRWVGQFEGRPAPVRATREVDGLRVTTVEIDGTYLAPGGPMMQSQGREPDTTLLGLIVEGPQGPVFFKCVGPGATMRAQRSAFEALAASLRRE